MSPSGPADGDSLYGGPCDGGTIVDSNTPDETRCDALVESQPAPRPSRRDRARASLEERLARPSPTVWLSGQEAAEYVGVSWPTLRQALLDHQIPHVRIGTRWKIDVAVLDEHLHRVARAG